MAEGSRKINSELFAGYIPVLHDGYIRAFNRHPNATIGVLGHDVVSEHAEYLRKDIRALSPEDAEKAIVGLGRSATILSLAALENALKSPIVMPNDDITRSIKTAYPDADITLEPVFLRWDRDNVSEKNIITPDRIVTVDSNDPVIETLNQEIAQCTNWWRHVGAAVLDENHNLVLSSHNTNQPTEHASLYEGDPRISSRKGEAIELTNEIHAEASLVAEAGKHGIKLEDDSIYVSTFPCPNCAKLIGVSGIKKCYYVDGYSMLDGENILRAYGVELIKVDTELAQPDPRSLKPYPKK